MREPKDRLSEAITRLRQQGQTENVPTDVAEETLRRIAESGVGMADSSTSVALPRHPRFAVHGFFRLAAAAAIFISIGYGAGRFSAPKPPDMDQLRAALIPSVADALEPALRKRVGDDLRRDYQLALAGMYVRVKEELTDQYRGDLNRFALQTLAASNAVTNKLLLQLVQSIDTAQAQDRRRIAEVISEIENNRVQDKTQLASGLQTLAYRTEDELSRTQRQLAQLLVNVRPVDWELPSPEPRPTPKERNKP
jgi:hypothetical protein